MGALKKMDNLNQSEVAPLDLFRLVHRQWWKILLVLVLGLGATAAYTALSPLTFKSEAKLFVRVGRESVALDPTATTGNTVTLNESRDSELNSISELLASRLILEQVVDELGPERVLGVSEPAKEIEARRIPLLDSVRLNPFRVYSLRDKAIKSLGQGLTVRIVKRSCIVSLSAEAAEPDLAQEILETLIRSAREEHLRVNRTKGSHEFFNEQAEKLKAQLATQEGELRDLKNKSGLAAHDQQREIHLARIGELERELSTTETNRKAAEAEVESRRATLARLPETIITEEVRGQPNTVEDGMRQQLYALQLKEKELSAKYQDDTFIVKQAREQVALAQEVLDKEVRKHQVTRGVSKSRDELLLALHNREATLVALRAQSESLQSELATAKSRIESLNEDEIKIAQYQRAIDLAATNYRKYAENLEQARIDSELETEKISNINVLQAPTYSLTPASPRIKLNLAVGAALSLALAAGLAVMTDRRPASQSRERPSPPASENSDPPRRRRRAERVVANPR